MTAALELRKLVIPDQLQKFRRVKLFRKGRIGPENKSI